MATVRKQICDLTLADLDQHPAWEFALDEETVEGQDEATVRPVDHLQTAPHNLRIVHTNFILADGTRLRGYVYAQSPGDTSMGGIQPAIVTGRGQVHFWHGIREPSRAEMDNALAKLGRTTEQTFPLTFESEDKAISGALDGFMFLNRQDMQERSIS